MKQHVTKLIVIAAALILCVLILSICLKKCGSDEKNASSAADNAPVEQIENVEEPGVAANNATAEADKTAAETAAETAVAGNDVSFENGAELNTAVPVADSGSDAQPFAVPVADTGPDAQATAAEENVFASNQADEPENSAVSYLSG